MILAAGYATRLYPLTRDYPKPLLKVKGRPVINYIVDKLNKSDAIKEIIVVTNSRFIGKFKAWRRGLKLSKKISLVDDCTKSNKDRLGAIGDIDFVLKSKGIKEDLLVVGGDNLFSGSIRGLIASALKNKPYMTIAAYRLKDKKDANKYGVLKVGRDNRVVDFKEKPSKPDSSLVAMCLYYIPKEQLSLISFYLRSKKDKADATGKYIDWLRKRADIYCYLFKGIWYDIGDYKYLNEAKKSFK